MFSKILIANRGEIACRIIQTAHDMGIRCVAVYSDADANARHVAMADEAFHIGPAPSSESYLRSEKIIEIAKESGAQAIHPGYGFLSENTEFAEACEANNLVFIGPPSSAIAAMGSKSAAKAIMEKAGVPLVPGYHGDDQAPETLRTEAEKCGFPLLLKAVVGGGGKGMRVVERMEEFDDALAAAKREAKNAFGNPDMLIERYLTQPRHVEIQVFCDQEGKGQGKNSPPDPDGEKREAHGRGRVGEAERLRTEGHSDIQGEEHTPAEVSHGKTESRHLVHLLLR